MVNTPFGPVVVDAKPAPTAAEVAANPGKFDGTSFDPCELVVPDIVVRNNSPEFGGLRVFRSWFNAAPEAAMEWFERVYGAQLNLNAISGVQRKKLGL